MNNTPDKNSTPTRKMTPLKITPHHSCSKDDRDERAFRTALYSLNYLIAVMTANINIIPINTSLWYLI